VFVQITVSQSSEQPVTVGYEIEDLTTTGGQAERVPWSTIWSVNATRPAANRSPRPLGRGGASARRVLPPPPPRGTPPPGRPPAPGWRTGPGR
jgi:hypothetical protein